MQGPEPRCVHAKHTHKHTHIHVHTYTYKDTHTHTQTLTHTQTHTHTHQSGIAKEMEASRSTTLAVLCRDSPLKRNTRLQWGFTVSFVC
jgi:hypothetical protein